MTSTVQRAALLQERGLRVFPVDHPAHPQCIGSSCFKLRREGKDPDCNRDNRKRRGKHPIGGWTTIAATTHGDKYLLHLFADRFDSDRDDYQMATVNIGIACKASGVLVIDEDILEAFQRFAEDRGQVIDCNYRVQTGKGVHYYFGPPECGTPIGNRSGTLVEWGIDVRGGVASSNNGGYVLAPGSTHASGAIYTELDEWPGKENLRPFPAWLVPEVRAQVSAAKTTPLGMDGAGLPSQERAGAGGHRSAGGTVFGGSGAHGEGWTDEVRYGSRAELVTQFERHVLEAKALAGLPSPGSEWRHRFFLAVLDGWRLINLGARRVEVEARLLAAIQHVWAAGPDAGDEAIVAEAKAKAAASPWELYEEATAALPAEADASTPPSAPVYGPPDDEVRAVFLSEESETLTDSDRPSSPGPADDTSDDALTSDAGGMPWEGGAGFTLGDAPVDMAAVYARTFDADVAKRAHQLKVERAAKLRVAMELRGDRPSILDELIDVRELDQIKPPSMLMNELVPKASLGFLAGKFGTYKSFIAVAIACCLATGRALAGAVQFAVESAVPVLYVASEGAAGVAQRVQAWESAHGPIPAGMLKVYPKPIKLNDEVAVAELAAVVESLGVGVVIVDTYHRSAPGTEENNSTEFGLVFEAMASIRDRYDTTTIFVDHTGKAGVTMRGTSAKEDDADFALIVDLEFTPNDSRGREVQRTLRVRKRKDMPSEGEWDVRLVEVASVGESGSAYIELGSVDRDESAAVFDAVKRPDTWFQADITVPVQVAEASRTGNGRAAVLDVFRVMSYGYWDGGQTMAEIAAGVRSAEKLGGIRYDPNTVRAAIKNLIGCGIAEPMDPAKPAGRVTLAQGYAPPKYK